MACCVKEVLQYLHRICCLIWLVLGETGTDDVLCNLFLGQGFTKSGMLFFDEKGEIVKAVATKFNRIVIWNATLDFRLKQPAFESFKTKYSLLIRFTRSSTKMANELSYIKVSCYFELIFSFLRRNLCIKK